MSEIFRADLDVIVSLVPAKAKVLDLGCGDGTLLERLAREKDVEARGVELLEDRVRTAISRGLSVRHGNIEEGLLDYRNGSLDYVILSQTLPYLDNPARVVGEMLRVGGHAIISFNNAGYWQARLRALRGGGFGLTLASGEPRERAITLPQFEEFCAKIGAVVENAVFLSGRSRATFWPRLLAQTAVYVIRRRSAGSIPLVS